MALRPDDRRAVDADEHRAGVHIRRRHPEGLEVDGLVGPTGISGRSMDGGSGPLPSGRCHSRRRTGRPVSRSWDQYTPGGILIPCRRPSRLDRLLAAPRRTSGRLERAGAVPDHGERGTGPIGQVLRGQVGGAARAHRPASASADPADCARRPSGCSSSGGPTSSAGAPTRARPGSPTARAAWPASRSISARPDRTSDLVRVGGTEPVAVGRMRDRQPGLRRVREVVVDVHDGHARRLEDRGADRGAEAAAAVDPHRAVGRVLAAQSATSSTRPRSSCSGTCLAPAT